MSNISSYVPFDASAHEKAEKASKSKSSFISKITVGTHRYRILPALPGEVAFFVKIAQHWVDAQNGSGRVPFNCPQLMSNAPCPACMQRATWAASGDPRLMAAAEKLEANEQILVNVIDRSCPEEGIKVWSMRPTILREILDQYELNGKQDFTNPGAEGRDVQIKRTGTGRQDTRYTVSFSDKCGLGESVEQTNQWMADAKPLSQRAEVLSLEQIGELIKNGRPKKSAMPKINATPQIGAVTAGASSTAPVVDASAFEAGDDDSIPF